MPVNDYYDANKWNLQNENRPVFEREQKSIDYIKNMKGVKSILDVGCGDGFFLVKLQEALGRRQIELWGVDYSKYKLRQARKLGFHTKWCDLEQGLPFPDASLDVIYAAELIEHLYNPDFFLEECRRVLKPKGTIIVSTPNLQAWYNRLLFILGIQPIFYEVSTRSPQIGSGVLKRIKKGQAPVGHVHVFNKAGLVDMLRAEGFELLDFVGAQFHALPRPAQILDKLFNARPSMASNLVAVARKTQSKPIAEES
ncbi:MAG TPA: methyltransferase domain-containing protein [Candidatus Saccharimonadales bacterium]|nr:methyltransferase domain-containing protein [Candidatus Saccharimonadales bacterium]